MARATTIVTDSFQQIASGAALFTIKKKGKGALIFNETATDSNANLEHPQAGGQFTQTEAKATHVRAQQANAGWEIITDGDIRRYFMSHDSISDLPAKDMMSADPKTVGPDSLASQALDIMEKHEITVLPVVNPAKKVRGILHLHDILGKGAFRFDGD